MILVVGATGSLGSKITRGLIERGEAVRVLARPTSAYLPLERAGANVARARSRVFESASSR